MRRDIRPGAALAGLALLLGAARSGRAQVPIAGLPPGAELPAQAVTDLNRVAHEMAERVRHLGEDIASDLGDAPEGRHLLEDTRELAVAVDEFHEGLHETRDVAGLRRAYSGIDTTWHHLKAQLARRSSPAIDRAALRVEQLDAQIHQALGLGTLPLDYYTAAPDASAFPEIRRLGRSLDDRAQNLAAIIAADMAAQPDGRLLIRQVADLARAARLFDSTLGPDVRPDIVANGFAPVAAAADELDTRLIADGVPPRVAQAWQDYAAADVLLRQHLGMRTPPPTVRQALRPAEGPSPVIALTDTLLGQIDAFLDAFTPTAGVVPQGGAILADARRLRAEAAGFRQEVAAGINSARLAADFRGVDAAWNVLARRINRVARGRTGPNIQTAMQMGGTLAQIHRILGMPGYAPVLALPGP